MKMVVIILAHYIAKCKKIKESKSFWDYGSYFVSKCMYLFYKSYILDIKPTGVDQILKVSLC